GTGGAAGGIATHGSAPFAAAVLLPSVAALAVLLLHWFVPNGQLLPMSWTDSLPAWRHPYPVLLEACLTASLLAAGAAQTVLRDSRFRPWFQHNAPLLASAFV